MASRIATPRYCIKHSRFTKYGGWRLYDVSLSLNGNIAVTGFNEKTKRTYIDVYANVRHSDSRDKPKIIYPKIIYSKEFEKKYSEKQEVCITRIVSFIDDDVFVSCLDDKLEVFQVNKGEVLRSRRVNGWACCLCVKERREIFVGFRKSNKITVFDVRDLNEIKAIFLHFQESFYPFEITAITDKIFVCAGSSLVYLVDGKDESNHKTMIFEEKNGRILSELSKPTDTARWYVGSAGVNMNMLGIAGVLWRDALWHKGVQHKQIVFYSLLNENNCSFHIVEVESGVVRIRISDRGDRIITGNKETGEVKVYDMASIFSYKRLKENLVSRLGRDDCEMLADFFAMDDEKLKGILNSYRPASSLLLALEEKGVIQPCNVSRLEEAFLGLKMSPPYHAVNMYQKLRDQISSYDRFLATLSAHLTSSVPAELCDYFHVSDEQKNSIISSQNPGLSLLLVLDEMGIIKPSEVGCLEEPFKESRLVQALAKIDEYKEIVKEGNRQLPQPTLHSLEDKRSLFVQFLKKKIKSWYETMTPVPWKKSCQWKSTDLFVGSGLILTDSKAKQDLQNIDEQCKLNYTEIFTHEKLKSEIRIILEGDPGAGKTMLLSQLAYDWSEGKIDGVDILIFLPLKIVENKTLIQATKEFYIPTNAPLSGNDIESILASDTERICLLLDGLEEYSTGGRMSTKESSEVMKIMKKEKHSNCKVVITCRSDFAHDLPEFPMLKLGRFGGTERNSYIEKLSPHNTDKQQKIKRIIQDNPFILDLCSVPLLFVLAVHNVESMSLSEVGQLNKVSPFMRSMILTLCSSDTIKHEVDGIQSKFFGKENITLGELAYNGLCKGHQQLSWQIDFMESNVGNFRFWVDSGILVLEEGLVISEKDNQDISQINKGEEVKEKTEKEKRKGALGELPVLSEDIVTTSMSASKTGHEVSRIEEQHQSVSERETEPHVMKKETVRRATGQVPLTVKFLHKVIQEWFAATFFSSMMRSCTSNDQFQNYVSSQLKHISPTDLHYVLRFTSYLHPPSCHVIMNYLLSSYRKDESVPPYIMNCVFLCFIEHNDIKGPDMKNAVKDVCDEVIKIQSEDSRLLQQAKSSLLQYTSNERVIVKKLELRDVISSVNETTLTLNSGVQLGMLDTVKVLEISRWDQVFQEDDHKNILKIFSKITLLKELCCVFPSQPPELDEITLENFASKDMRVEWHIGHFVHSLDSRKGKWMIIFKQPGTTATRTILANTEQATLSVQSTITNDGGSLKIAGTDVQLIVPAGAFKEERSECLIRLSIIPPGSHDEASTSFSSNSSTIVELLPNNLTLKLPVQVTLPHCLQLKKGTQSQVKIFMSHHEGDSQPRWEEVFDHRYILDDKKCTIWMERFCWTKYEIDDEIVEAKKITLFTAAEPVNVPDDIAKIQVGYHLDLPGAGEILRLNPSLIVGQQIPCLFFREGKHPLMVFLSTILPKTWTYSTPEDNPQEIPFQRVASSVEYACPFILQHDTDTTKVPTCIFKASQNKNDFKLQIRPKVVTAQKQPSCIHCKAEVLHQENVTTQAEENTVRSEQLKESPQDASFQLPLTIPWKTPDAAVRRTLPLQENQHEIDRYSGSNLKALHQSQEACQNVFQTHGQMSPYHEYQMLPHSGQASPVPTNPFIQQNYYHQNFSISPYGAPFVGGQSLYEFPDKVNREGVTLGYSLMKELGRKLDPVDPLGNNWKELADKLRFTMEDIGVFELAPSPTFAVIECAVKSGKLKSIGQLKTILEQINRNDASLLLTLPTTEDESKN